MVEVSKNLPPGWINTKAQHLLWSIFSVISCRVCVWTVDRMTQYGSHIRVWQVWAFKRKGKNAGHKSETSIWKWNDNFSYIWTALPAICWEWQCGNTNARLVSVSKVRFWGGKSALRLSNQREIKTAHGRLIKVSMRTCETPLLPAEQKYKLLEWRREHLGRTEKPSDKCFPPTIQNNGWGGDGKRLRCFLCIIYHMMGSHLKLLCFHLIVLKHSLAIAVARVKYEQLWVSSFSISSCRGINAQINPELIPHLMPRLTNPKGSAARGR